MPRSAAFLSGCIYPPCFPSERRFPFAPTLGGRSGRAVNADRVFLPQVTSFPGAAGGDEGSRSRSGEESHLGRSQRLDHAGPSAGEELVALVSKAPKSSRCGANAGGSRSLLFGINILLGVELFHFAAC